MRIVTAFLALMLMGSMATAQSGSPAYALYSVAHDGSPGNGDSGKTGIAKVWANSGAFGGQQNEWVVFDSEADNLVPGDTNGVSDIFAYDMLTGRVSLVSRGLNGPADGASSHVVGAGYRYVLYQTDASNIVAGDTNGVRDIILHDILTGVNYGLTQPLNPNGDCSRPFTRPEWYEDYQGNHWQPVLFESTASNLVPNDTNGFSDIFKMAPLDPTTIVRVSQKLDGTQADGPSYNPSEDGQLVLFDTQATNLFDSPDGNGVVQDAVWSYLGTIYCRTQYGSLVANGPSYSIQGNWVAFLSDATNLVAGDTNGARDLFRWSEGGELVRLSVGPSGEQLDGGTTAYQGGRFVTSARNAMPSDNLAGDELIYEPLLAQTSRPLRSREFFGRGWTEPKGQIWLFRDGMATNAPNANGGSSFAQVVGAPARAAKTRLLVVSMQEPGARRYGAYELDMETNQFTGFAQWGRLADPWMVVGSVTIAPGHVEAIVHNPTTNQFAAWSMRGMKPVHWSMLGRLAPGWVPDTVFAVFQGPGIYSQHIVARRASDNLIADYRFDRAKLAEPRVLGRIAGRFVGEHPSPSIARMLWWNPTTRRLGGWAVGEKDVSWLPMSGQVADGWDVIQSARLDRGDGRLLVRRRSDGRLGFYRLSEAGIIGWQTLPRIAGGWEVHHLTRPMDGT